MPLLPRTELLAGSEHRDALARVIDLAEQALKTWTVQYSDFLSPPQVEDVLTRFQPLADVQLLAGGGFPQAERQRLAIGRSGDPLDAMGIPLNALAIQGNFLFDPANHRDFLGALLGTGLVIEKVGDILVLGEIGAQAIVVPELVEFLQFNLKQVRSVPVQVKLIPLEQLKIRPPRTKEINTVEASMRLDAIASAGFSMSRSKMVDDIHKGDVRVNWKSITQSSHTLQSGDIISVSGRGRVEVKEVSQTQKGRYRIQLLRYL